MPSHLLVSVLYGSAVESELRQAPFHGFSTAGAIFLKRFNEQRRLDIFTINAVMPFLGDFDKKMKAHSEDEEDDFEVEKLTEDMKSSAWVAFIAWSNVIARVSVQSIAAACLVRMKRSYANAITYAWELQARLPERYIGDLFACVKLGRLRYAIGPKMTENDIAFFETAKSSALVAFEGAFLRTQLITFSELVVETAKLVMSHKRGTIKRKERDFGIVSVVVVHSGDVAVRCVGAMVGYLVKGNGAGEFFGEKIAQVLFSFFASPVIRRKLKAKYGLPQSPRPEAPKLAFK